MIGLLGATLLLLLLLLPPLTGLRRMGGVVGRDDDGVAAGEGEGVVRGVRLVALSWFRRVWRMVSFMVGVVCGWFLIIIWWASPAVVD